MSEIITQQNADSAIEASHRETAARALAINQAEAQRRQAYRNQMAEAVRVQGAASKPGAGEGAHQTGDTQRHIADMAARAARAGALTNAEQHDIDTSARHALMRANLGEGKPLPTTEACAAAGRAAVNAAVAARLAK
jgi:hypothetical protein